MKFALGMPGLILYPPIMSPWEPTASAEQIVSVARKADEVGWHWLTISEHIVMPNAMTEVMGRRFPEAVTAASVLAGATKRIKFMPYVLVLPYRHPVMLAKEIATLDFLSGGRFTLGTAVGHLEGEFDVLDVSFEDRGRLTDEYLEAIIELWTKDSPSFEGKYVKFRDIAFEPKPAQKPYPQIFIGGNTKVAMRRAARFGDGWMPWLVKPEDLPGCLAYIREQPGFRVRRERFEVVMPVSELEVEDYSHRIMSETHLRAGRDELVDAIGRMQDAGVTITQVPPPRTKSVEELLDWSEWFAREIMPRFPDR